LKKRQIQRWAIAVAVAADGLQSGGRVRREAESTMPRVHGVAGGGVAKKRDREENEWTRGNWRKGRSKEARRLGE
jgi:hypothetical protein